MRCHIVAFVRGGDKGEEGVERREERGMRLRGKVERTV